LLGLATLAILQYRRLVAEGRHGTLSLFVLVLLAAAVTIDWLRHVLGRNRVQR